MKGSVPGVYAAAYIGPRLRRQLLALGTLLGVSAGAAAAPAMDVREGIAYGPLPMEQGDLYIPAEPRGRKPAVVVIHGGGWVEGSRSGDTGLSQLIAAQGAVAFNIDYRLADAARADTRWPAQLVDAQLAVRFLRANADAFGIDPARIGAIGDSAGAQLAVFLGVLPRTVPGDMAGLHAGEQPGVVAVVDQFGPMDLGGMGSYAGPSLLAMFGTPQVPGTTLLTASPLPSVGAHSAPVYIIHGEGDQTVPFQQSRQLADTLRAHDVATELVPYAGGHAYEGLGGDDVGRLQVNAVKWLVARLQR